MDKLEEEELRELEEIDYDELDFSKPEDEEISRAQNEKFDIQMELEQRRWGSGHLSRCCKNISESIEVLEKSIRKKPYYGMMIKLYNNSAREPIDDIMSRKLLGCGPDLCRCEIQNLLRIAILLRN